MPEELLPVESASPESLSPISVSPFEAPPGISVGAEEGALSGTSVGAGDESGEGVLSGTPVGAGDESGEGVLSGTPVGAAEESGAGVLSKVPVGAGEGEDASSPAGGRVGVAPGISGVSLGVGAGPIDGSGEREGHGVKEAFGSLSRKSSETGLGEGRMERSVRLEKSARSCPAFPMISSTARWAPSTEFRRRSTCPVRLPEEAEASRSSWVSRS